MKVYREDIIEDIMKIIEDASPERLEEILSIIERYMKPADGVESKKAQDID